MNRLRANDVLVAIGLTAIVFVRAFGLYPWYDDWMYLSAAGDALARHAPGAFVWNPFPPHWSPLSFAFELLNLELVGWKSDIFVRLTVAVLVFAGLLLFAGFARPRGLGTVAVAAGMATLALHHTNAAAFYAFDCYDQIVVDLLTWTSVTLLISGGSLASAIGLYVPALLVKEQALALPMLVAVLTAWQWIERRSTLAIRRLGIAAAILIAMSALFALLRWRAGLWFDDDGPYRLCLQCISGNVGLLAGSLISPTRTLDVFQALATWPPTLRVVLPVAVAAAAVLSLIVSGVMKYRQQRGDSAALLYVLLAVASFFPVVILPGVTELYAHTALFWFALIVAMAVEGWWTAGVVARSVVGLAFAVYFISLTIGLQLNLAEMRASGERSRTARERLHAQLGDLPRGTRVLVRGLPMVKAPGDYGLYRVTAPGYLLAGGVGVAWAAPDGLRICRDVEECGGSAEVVADVDEAGFTRTTRVTPR